MEVVTRARPLIVRRGGRIYEYAEVRVLLARDYVGQEFIIIPKSECEGVRTFIEFARTVLELVNKQL